MLEEQRRAVMAGVMSGPSKSGELSFFQKVPEKIKMLEINLSFLQVHSLLCSLLALLVHSYKYLQKSTFPSSRYTVYLLYWCKSANLLTAAVSPVVQGGERPKSATACRSYSSVYLLY